MAEGGSRVMDILLDSYYKQLCKLQQTGTFCDGEIIVQQENQRFPIHKIILASCSPYFCALFTSGWQESKNYFIEIPGIRAGVIETIVNYAYTHKVTITEENVEDLFQAADRLQLFGIQKACVDFLVSQTTISNCIGIYKFSLFYQCEYLTRKTWEFIMRNFSDIAVRGHEFHLLSKEELEQILESDELNIVKEEMALVAIERWIYRKPKVLVRSLPQLLKTIRLRWADPTVVKKLVSEHSFFSKNKDCQALVVAARQLHRDMRGEATAWRREHCMRSRIPHDVIFVIGGWEVTGVTTRLESYDIRTNRWLRLPCDLPSPSAYHSAVSLNNLIYVIGGYDGTSYFNGVHCFDPVRKRWSEAAPMHLCRCYVAGVALDGCIYACGGYDGQHRHRTVERYQKPTNQWTFVASMQQKRSDAGVAAFNGLLFVAGGFDGQNCLDSSEMYDLQVDQWTLLHNINMRRSGVGMAALNKDVYIFGGFNGVQRLQTVEKYNVQTGHWVLIQDMFFGRSNFAVSVIEGIIFVIGGYDGTSVVTSVECFDWKTNAWYIASDMNCGRSATSACVLSGMATVKDFTSHGGIVLDEEPW